MSTNTDGSKKSTSGTSGTERGFSRRKLMKLTGAGAAAVGLSSVVGLASGEQAVASVPASASRKGLEQGDTSDGADNFYTSDKVTVRKVSFRNRYEMKVVGNLFTPNNLDRRTGHPALVVGHPMGAVKEQSANLYATKMAEQGFVSLSFDLSFWGESAGKPGNAVAPDVYSEDFSAAVDFLRTQSFVDKDRVGAIGVCGSGSFVLGAAKIDPRIKAIATVSMYDMGAANRDGLRKSVTLEQRKAMIAQAAAQRDVEFAGGKIQYTGGTPEKLTATSSPVDREFYDFYRTARGYHPNTTTHPALATNAKFMNFHPFADLDLLSPRPLLFITGDQAHSREFSEEAYRRATGPKELFWVPGAGHVDLYDRVGLIPFNKLTDFFRTNL
ncbi:alpha/beta hydrolase [Paeniglutamicibacter sp. ORCA_105]|uniref:alpha/beta hydrolase n=1 Tax=Paeniglutamicibacter sp. ORCA_105 TaxID=3377336 RepID=UPI003895E39A